MKRRAAGQSKGSETDFPTVIERAFEPARSGKMRTVHKIRRRLRTEGFSSDAVQGRAPMTQLKGIVADRRRRTDAPIQALYISPVDDE